MKTNRTFIFIAAIFLLAVFFILGKHGSSTGRIMEVKKTFLTVSDAKAKAFTSETPQRVINLKGIYTVGEQSPFNNYLLLEDEEPTGMEDVPLYCLFNTGSREWLQQLEPGTELTVTGILSWNGSKVEVTDCNILCINKGTITADTIVW
jgi:hypothetical protein